jgi:hypothetical protein
MDAMTQQRHQFALARLAWLIGLAVLAALMARKPGARPVLPGRPRRPVGRRIAPAGRGKRLAAGLRRRGRPARRRVATGDVRARALPQALPDARRGEYVQLTRQFLGQFLARRAGRIAGAQLQIVGCSSEAGYAYVDTRAGGQRVIWRLEGGRIIDVNVGGIWLTQQMRSNFVSVIQRGNGDPAALIDYLRSGRSFG